MFSTAILAVDTNIPWRTGRRVGMSSTSRFSMALTMTTVRSALGSRRVLRVWISSSSFSDSTPLNASVVITIVGGVVVVEQTS